MSQADTDGMTEPENVEVGEIDTPPEDGVFRDWDGEQLKDEVVAQGNHIGAETPDVDFVEVEGEVLPL